MTRTQADEALFQASGRRGSEDPLVALLYLLMRDEMPVGALDKVVMQLAGLGGSLVTFTNGFLVEHAEYLAAELRRGPVDVKVTPGELAKEATRSAETFQGKVRVVPAATGGTDPFGVDGPRQDTERVAEMRADRGADLFPPGKSPCMEIAVTDCIGKACPECPAWPKLQAARAARDAAEPLMVRTEVHGARPAAIRET